MTTELAPYTRRPATPARQFSADWLLDPAELAQRIGGTDFVPQSLRNNPAAITAALLYGEALGLHPMIALAEISVINGRPTVSAKQLRALVLVNGHLIWFDESTITRCTVAGRRRGTEEITRIIWTLDDARRANLAGKQAWKLYPRQMLQARASAELARLIFPDAIGGLMTTEELEDEPDLAQAGNGPQPPPAKTTTRRRRSSVTVGADPAQDDEQPTPLPPQTSPTPQASPSPTTPPSPPTSATPAEPEQPPQPPEPEHASFTDEPDMITDPQRRKMHATFRDKGVDGRDAMLAYCGGVIGRQLTTSTGLTRDEASQILDHLEQFDYDNPQTWPLPEGF